MDRWPMVTFGGSHEPYVDRVLDEMPFITRPKVVAAYGTVEGYPWSLVLFEKRGDPEDDEDMMPGYVAAPARFEFFLGGSPGLPASQFGGLGGGGTEIRLRPGMHFDTTAESWPTTPPVIGYVMFLSDSVCSVRVAPDDAEARTVEAMRPLDEFPKFSVFFPPFGMSGEIAALDASGEVLQRRKLFSGRIPIGGGMRGGD